MNETSTLKSLIVELKNDYYLGTRQRRMLATLDKRFGINSEIQMAEIGVDQGLTSELLLRVFPSLFLHMIDPWRGELRSHMEETKKRIKPYLNRTAIYWMLSTEACGLFNDSSLDVVFLDADHSYRHVLHDLKYWWRTIKKGGLLCGDDYNGKMERLGGKRWKVKKAVDDFVSERGLTVEVETKNFFWIVKH